MLRITHFLCYHFGLKFASVLFFTLFPSLASLTNLLASTSFRRPETYLCEIYRQYIGSGSRYIFVKYIGNISGLAPLARHSLGRRISKGVQHYSVVNTPPVFSSMDKYLFRLGVWRLKMWPASSRPLSSQWDGHTSGHEFRRHDGAMSQLTSNCSPLARPALFFPLKSPPRPPSRHGQAQTCFKWQLRLASICTVPQEIWNVGRA